MAGCFGPGKIAGHGAFHQRGPRRLVAKNVAGVFDRVPTGVGRFFVAEKTETGIYRRIVVLDDFLDAAGGAGDWKRAVLQAVHSAQSARFDFRWDQRDVDARFDEMRERFVVMTAIGELRGILARGDGERGFVAGVAFAEDDQSDVVGEKPVEQRHNKIEAFFRNEARHHSEDWSRWCGSEAKPVEQQIATDSFAFEIFGTELARKQMIGRRIPAAVIGAVEDGEERSEEHTSEL